MDQQIDRMEWIQAGDSLDLLRGKFRAPPPGKNTAKLDDLLYTGEVVQPEEFEATTMPEAEVEGAPDEGAYIPDAVDEVPDCPIWADVTVRSGIQVNLKLFDWGLLRPDYTHLVYGKRRTGKTHYVKHLMLALRPYFPEVYIFTETKEDAEYVPHVPEPYIFSGFSNERLQMIIDRQTKRLERMRRRGINDENMMVLVLFDDCVGSKEVKNSKALHRAFYNGRHLYIGVIMTSQDTKALGPALRANADMVACFRLRSERDKDAIRSNFADFLKNNEDFDDLARLINEVRFNITFFDQSRPYMPESETIYCGVMPSAEETPAFFMGNRAFWSDSFDQLRKYGGERLIEQEDWGVVGQTYHLHFPGDDHKVVRPIHRAHGGGVNNGSWAVASTGQRSAGTKGGRTQSDSSSSSDDEHKAAGASSSSSRRQPSNKHRSSKHRGAGAPIVVNYASDGSSSSSDESGSDDEELKRKRRRRGRK